MFANRLISVSLYIFVAIFGLFEIVIHSPQLWSGALTVDVDSQMRMALLEWWVQHGTLLDYVFSRDGAPNGMTIHWTLPFDLASFFMALPFALSKGWHEGIYDAALISGPISYIFQLLAIAALARSLGLKHVAPWAMFVAALSPSIITYAAIGRLSHHGMTAAIGTMALASSITLIRKGSPRSAVLSAFWWALAAWESIELVPALLVAWAIVFCGASIRRKPAKSFLIYAGAIPVFVAIGLLIDPDPFGRFAMSVDRFSAYHFVLASVLSLGVVIATCWRGNTLRRFVFSSTLTAVPVVIVLAWGAILIPPALNHNMILQVYMHASEWELKPAWADMSHAFNALLPGIFAVLVPLTQGLRKIRRPQVVFWLLAFLILGSQFAVGLLHARLVPYAAAVGCVMLGSTLRSIVRRLTLDRDGKRSNAALVVICGVCILLALPKTMLSASYIKGGAPNLSGSCVLGADVAKAVEKALPPEAVVVVDLWQAPEVLWRTDLRVVGGPFHRNFRGIEETAIVFASEGELPIRAVLSRRKASAILACISPARADDNIFSDKSLERRLARGEVPAWLKQVDVGDKRFGLYLVQNP